MLTWITRLFRRPEAPLLETVDSVPPPWAEELLENLQKAARQQAKVALRLDDLNSHVEGGFADLRGLLQERRAAAAPPAWDNLLDALDLLEEATRVVEQQAGVELAGGLRHVVARLDRFLGQEGLERQAAAGVAPDGRLYRVVGKEARPDLPSGVITRVIRAAVTCQGRLLREGEALVNQKEEA